MEFVDGLQAVAQIASSVSTVGVLIFWVSVERKRSEDLMKYIVADWQRQNDREADKTRES